MRRLALLAALTVGLVGRAACVLGPCNGFLVVQADSRLVLHDALPLPDAPDAPFYQLTALANFGFAQAR